MNALYENGETELIAYLNELVNEALLPYCHQAIGHYDAVEIRDTLISLYEEGCQNLLKARRTKTGKDYQQISATLIAKAANLLCQKINTCLSTYFLSHSHGSVYLIDFGAFKGDIALKMRKIIEKNITTYSFSA